MNRKTYLVVLFTFISLSLAMAWQSNTMAVQGIARDAEGNAQVEKALNLTFELFYRDSNGQEQNVRPAQSKNITTDNFGVFSTRIFTAANGQADLYAQNNIWLRISEGDNLISEQRFSAVPYSIASKFADNGVPTGSIMPWIGENSDVPDGWVVCNGQDIPGAENNDLRALLGDSRVPDLRGAFLRGWNGSGSYQGPGVGAFQNDSNKEHDHWAGGLTAVSAGDHTHKLRKLPYDVVDGGTQDMYTLQNTSGSNEGWDFVNNKSPQRPDDVLSTDGAHEHNVNGKTGTSGGSESRPYNFGVRYIIKQ